jgi:hypothetical protein
MLLVLYLYLKETNFWDPSKIVTCFLSFFLASVETTNFWYPLKFVTFLRMFIKHGALLVTQLAWLCLFQVSKFPGSHVVRKEAS